MTDPQSEFVEKYAPRGPRGPKGDQGTPGKRGDAGALPPRARRSLLARDITIVGLLLLNFLFTAHQVNASQHTWCQTLDLLTRNPVTMPADPAANPSRVHAYQQYVALYDQGRRLGCF